MHIFRLVNIFLSEITWRFPIYSGVFTKDKIIHDSGRWPCGMICFTHECKPRGVCMFLVKVSLKRKKVLHMESFSLFFKMNLFYIIALNRLDRDQSDILLNYFRLLLN